MNRFDPLVPLVMALGMPSMANYFIF